MSENKNELGVKQSPLMVAGVSAFVGVLATIVILSLAGWLTMPMIMDHQAMIHNMGSQVMPFDLTKTTHIFEMTESGGIQQVVAKDPNDSAQIALIQQHIQHEVTMFSVGDFSDSMSLHGNAMPGLKELAAGASQIKIEYTALSNGAQITFATQDLHLITAVHRWFGAQLSDHGSDAATK